MDDTGLRAEDWSESVTGSQSADPNLPYTTFLERLLVFMFSWQHSY